MSKKCECKIVPEKGKYFEEFQSIIEGIEIRFCPLHVAAEEMLEMLKTYLEFSLNSNGPYISGHAGLIAKAEGRHE